MGLSDVQLGAIIQQAVARQLARPGADGADADGSTAVCREHPSHVMLPGVRGANAGDACLIEPAVRCSHCGYCQSYGH
jgi:hypothetical protein